MESDLEDYSDRAVVNLHGAYRGHFTMEDAPS